MPPRRTRLDGYAPRSAPSKTNLTDIDMEFAILETREASYAPPTKRSKAGWPHKSPSVAALAKAGFFYQPSSGKDNVECFMCARQLDGWEKDDDPLQEHLKHGSDCAWALLMSIEQEPEHDTSDMNDPTGERIADARRGTFESIGWPHEGKKGWVCKTDRMVEAGWYFAPTTECEDYTSCIYCKLSLDGWEPKDDPFEEHHRRSPDCPFFAFAGAIAPSKRPKQKTGRASRSARTSKASRLSTQSNATLLSQAESIADLDQSTENVIDNSIVSIQSTTSTTTKAKRKAPARAKAGQAKKKKATRSKKQELSPEPEPEPASRAGPVGKASIPPTQSSKTIPTSKGKSRSARSGSQTINNSVTVQEEASYPRLPQDPPDEQFEDAASDFGVIEPGTPPTQHAETGPPRKEHSPIPVKQISPLKEQSKPPRPTISPVHPKQSPLKRRSLQKSRAQPAQSSDSQESEVENVPPPARSNVTRQRQPSPGAPAPEWTPVDINTIFKSDKDAELFGGVINGELSDEEKNMTVQEWIQHIAAQAEAGLSQEGERMVGIFEGEGRRALHVLESIQCS